MKSYRYREPAATPRRKSRRPVSTAVAAGGLLLIAFAGFWAVRGLLPADPEPRLSEARAALTALLAEPESPQRRQEYARRAETLLRGTFDAEGPHADTARLLLASALLVLGETGEAHALLADCDTKRTATADLERTAVIAFRTSEFGLADRLIGEALSRSDHSETTLQSAIEIRYDLGRDEDVIAHAEELLKQAPDDPRPLLVLALVYSDRGAWDQVIEACREFLRLQPEDAAEVRLMLIDALINIGAAEEARRELDRLAADAPGLAERTPLLEARLLNLEGRDAEALSRADRVLKEDPKNVEALLLRGRILTAQADYPSAIAALETLTQADPANFEAHYLLGQAYSRTGMTEQARRELRLHRQLLDAKVEIHRLERRAGRNPADVEVRRQLARRYHEIGVPELAAFWEQAAASAEGGGGE